MSDIRAFAARDQGLTRRQKCAKDTKPFWARAAVLFNDPTFSTVLFDDPEGHDLSPLSGAYSGHRTDSSQLEVARFGPLRTGLDKAFGAFAISGGGDGGPVDPASLYIMSSRFWNFCNGDIQLYYFYVALAKHNALKCTVSAMEPGDSFGSDVPPRPVSGNKRRNSAGGPADDPDSKHGDGKAGNGNGDGNSGAPVVIHQTEDQAAASKAKRAIAEAKAMTVTDDVMTSQMAKLTDANSALADYEGAHGFVPDDFMHKAKKARVTMLEANISKLMPGCA